MRSARARRTTPALAGVLLSVSLWLVGCAAPPQWQALQGAWPDDLPVRSEVAGVPFHAQPGDTLCGPASLAMVAQAAGSRVSPAELTPQVYLPGRQGSLQTEMLAAARRQGLVPVLLAPELDSVLRELADGAPVLVLQNLALDMAPQWHYAVAVGYDRDAGVIRLHSGTNERLGMRLSTFERTWARSQAWAVRVAAPDRVPATATPEAWAQAVAALERIDPRAAQRAWRAALARWPTHRISLLGLGNASYGLGDRPAAQQAYEQAVRVHPDFADAWHNLAQVRLEQGDTGAAREAARRAVALGGPRSNTYQALLDALQKKLAP